MFWKKSKREKFKSADDAIKEGSKYSAKNKWKKASNILTQAIDDIASECGFTETMLTSREIESILRLPGADSLPKNDLSRLFNERGFMYRNMRQFDAARSDYTKSIELNPNYWRPYFNRANLRARDLKQFLIAIPDYDEAIRLNPTFADIFNNRGLTYDALKEYDIAMINFDMAIKLDPKHADAHSNKATIYYMRHQYQEAAFWYEKAVELNPNDFELHYNLSLAKRML
jgi:tetratricopeptide (TPR) repeat protein